MICIAGKNDIAVHGVQLALKYYKDICVCVNRTDDGVHKWQLSLKRYAEEHRIDIVPLEAVYDDPNLVFISLEYDRIIKPKLFKSPYLYNIHFSLLPKYRGMYTSAWPILNNENESGVTLHKIDQGIDTGNIIAQIKFPIDYEDTGRDLYLKYIRYGKKLLEEQITNLLDNHPDGIVQNKFLASYYSKKSIDYSNITIDLHQTAISIHNQIRAFSFKEYQLPMVFDSFIEKVEITNERSTKLAGTVLEETAEYYRVSSVDYDVVLKKYKN